VVHFSITVSRFLALFSFIVYTVEYYETEKKFCPVKAFIDSLPTMKMQAKALRDIGLLESLGTEIREPFSD